MIFYLGGYLPELPEVETVRKGLNQAILNKKIHNIMVHNPNLRSTVPVNKVKQYVTETVIVNIKRKAK